MNSIDESGPGQVGGRLFDALAACPVATPPFPTQADQKLSSYYVRRAQTVMTRADFDAPSCLTPDDFERRLAAYWGQSGHAELASLAPLVAAAAREFKALHEPAAPAAELSPYVYAMF
ncbi:MAG TPA: hypothetical protein VN089_01480 [Duganella sp.]|nr:hypothetical protein [Duganella sp.]